MTTSVMVTLKRRSDYPGLILLRGWAARQVPYKIGVLAMQSSQSSSLSPGHPWTKAQVGGHRSGGATTSWTSCLRLVVRGLDRPDNGVSEPYDRLCAIDRLPRSRATYGLRS